VPPQREPLSPKPAHPHVEEGGEGGRGNEGGRAGQTVPTGAPACSGAGGGAAISGRLGGKVSVGQVNKVGMCCGSLLPS
jgi:hypothetical protein